VSEEKTIAQAKAAGFTLVASSEINANSKDTAMHPKGVWTLPPRLALDDKDKDKYLAIGESDRMTLKFAKVAE
jgi:predicted methyltransferase